MLFIATVTFSLAESRKKNKQNGKNKKITKPEMLTIEVLNDLIAFFASTPKYSGSATEPYIGMKGFNFKIFYFILQSSVEKLTKQPNIQTCSVNNENENLVIVGDLRGNFRDLKYIIDQYGIPGTKHQFIFNGNLINYGKQQIEVLYVILFSFLLNPTRVFLNRGRFEDSSMGNSTEISNNFLADIKQTFNDTNQHKAYKASIEVFRMMPLATKVANRAGSSLFVVHGGIGNSTNLTKIENIHRKGFYYIQGSAKSGEDDLKDLIWSVPNFIKSNTNGLKKFGENAIKTFLNSNNFKYLITSGEIVNDNENNKDNYYTLFSASRFSNSNNKGTVIIYKHDSEKLKPIHYTTPDFV
jgi:hypothetical protein